MVKQIKRKLNIYTKKNIKFDIISGFVVFLVAIPLCLGIALASGAPLFAGLLSGIIGGIIVGILSNSQVSVSGPAAGMAAAVIVAITELQHFNIFLLALTFAGIYQIALGAFRAGFLSDYIPFSVIQGLLTAIGILLIIKQLPFAFTLSTDISELQEHLSDATRGFSLNPLTEFIYHLNVGAIIISGISFAILIYFDKTKKTWIKNIPAAILVVFVGVILNNIFLYFKLDIAQNYLYLVNIPQFKGISGFIRMLEFPDFSQWLNPKVYFYAFIIGTLASIESLLNIKASEKLDKKNRYCSKDRELFAQGVGNTVAGLIGGIPVTSVIVRTSVNVQAGSKTKASAILHGLYLLIAILSIPNVLNKIPLSSLAAILIFTGYKLAKPDIFISIYKQGYDRFIPFIITVLGIVIFNLLAGVMIGLIVSLIFILKANSSVRLDIIHEIYPNGITNRLVLPQQITFLSKAAMTTELNSIPRDSVLIIDATNSDYIDKEIIELIEEFQERQAVHKNISLTLMGFKEGYKIHDSIQFIPVTTYDVQADLKPHEVLAILHEGNQRFTKNKPIRTNTKIDIEFTNKKRYPIAVVISCIDSIVPAETIFDMGFGDILSIRVGATLVNEYVMNNLEYSTKIAGAKLIVVLGHTPCGIFDTLCQKKSSELKVFHEKLKPVFNELDLHSPLNPQTMKKLINYNTAFAISQIYNKFNNLTKMIDNEEIGIVGGIYDARSKHVTFKNLTEELKHFSKDHDALINNINKMIHSAQHYRINKRKKRN